MSWRITPLGNPVTILIVKSGLFALRSGDSFVPTQRIITMGRNEKPAPRHPIRINDVEQQRAAPPSRSFACIPALLRRFVRRLADAAVGTSFWSTDVAEAIAEHVGPQKIALFSAKLLGKTLLQM